MLAASQLVFDARWALRSHVHERYHELIVLSSGAVEARLDGRAADGGDGAVTVRAGESLLYPRGLTHGERAVGGRAVQMVCIAFEAPEAATAPLVSPDTEGRVRLLARWLAELTPTLAGTTDHQRTRDALLVAILAERAARAAGEDPIVQLVRRHVRDHLAEPIALTDLAELACLSRYHFARRFRAAAGVSPMAFVRQQRVEAARALLMTPGVPLRSVAKTVGLRDEFHLSRVYKRVTGVPPRGTAAGR
ncbi:MAG TPA: helix-turn-helix domain-containing protein [Tepidisphaeraceae bacterium]|nr:helix-turn-helix domain-containing protein [Tepidisphaeraceae bacterium]